MQMRRIWGRGLATLFTLSTLPLAAQAADFVVDEVGDPGTPGNGTCSLREALSATNSDTAVADCGTGSADGDTISFDGTVFALVSSIALDAASGALVISDDVSIDGTLSGAATRLTLDGGDAIRVTQIDTASGTGSNQAVSLSNLILTNGQDVDGGGLHVASGSAVSLTAVDVTSSSATGTAASNGGGGIYNAGTLTLTGGALTGNTATNGSGSGGGIYNIGTLSADGTTISSNSSARAGGGIETRDGASVTLANVTMDGNDAGTNPGNGGALHVTDANPDNDTATVTVTDSTFSNNSAGREGGGLWNHSASEMSISGSTISGNRALGSVFQAGTPPANVLAGGGGLFNSGGVMTVTNTNITGNFAQGDNGTAGDNLAGSGGGIFNKTPGTVTVTGGEITGNFAVRAGGGIESSPDTTTTLNGVDLSNNTAGDVEIDLTTTVAADPGNGGGFHVTGNGTVTINGGTVNNNVAAREGGGLWNGSGTMTVDGSTTALTINGNTASGPAGDDGGGGIFNNGGTLIINTANITNNIADGASGSGGGILGLGGSITATGAIITGNRANRAGGGIETAGTHALTLSSVTLNNNNAGVAPDAAGNPGNGGGLHVSGSGTVDISNSTINSNTASREGGGLWNQAGTVMTVSNSTLNGNSAIGAAAHDGGGALFNNGNGNATGNAELVLGNVTVSNNTATEGAGSGGGLLNLGGIVSITGGTWSQNDSARAGGAIEDRSFDSDNNAGFTTTMTITNVTVDNNSTGGNPGNGGGLHITGDDSTVTVSGSTFSNNTAAKEGGGLWNFGGSTLKIVNSTVSGNTASGTAADATPVGGGGLFNRPGGIMVVINSTVANNTATDTGGGVLNLDTGSLTLSNTLVGDNSAGTDDDASGAINADYSLIETVGSATITGGNNLSGDAGLAALALNGGNTQTHAITATSIAVGAADAAVCSGADVASLDQRGVPRDSECDIGAYELSDGPVVSGSSNLSTDATVLPGATNVGVLAFTLGNTSGETVNINSFSGSLGGTANVSTDISAARLYLDSDGDGVVDTGEPELTNGGGATLSLNGAAQTFSVAFSPARSLANNGSENYLLVVDVSGGSTVAMLGLGGAASLALIGMVAAPRRRWLLVVAAMAAGMASSGCRNQGNAQSPILDPTVRFTLTAVDARGATSNDPIQGLQLPLAGPTITINR